MSLQVSDFAAVQQAALCAAPVAVSAAVCTRGRDIWGVSDPLRLPPIAVQDPSRRGSLTPGMRVDVVRQYRAPSMTLIRAVRLSCVTLSIVHGR